MIAALTGFMACGKTTFGSRAALLVGWRFVDLDKEIAARHGMHVREIFATYGEPYFRKVESEVLEDVLRSEQDTVLALGGGTALSEENRKLIAKYARTIWIRTSMDIIWSKIGNTDRPLAKGRSREEIEGMYASRVPLYESVADDVLDVDVLDMDDVTERLAALILSAKER